MGSPEDDKLCDTLEDKVDVIVIVSPNAFVISIVEPDETSTSANLKELFELKESWSKQGFVYTNEQRKRYDELLKLRRERVKSFYKNDRVFKGPSSK